MNRLTCALAVLCGLAVACGSSDEDSAATTGPGGAGGAGNQGGVASVGGQGGSGGEAVDPGTCSGDIAWSDTTALGSPRDHHVTFIHESGAGPYLYVAGGNNYMGVFDDVFRAPIASDGNVGAWEGQTRLPYRRSGMGVVLKDGHVFVFGGRTIMAGLVDIPDVVSAPIDDAGNLGVWTEQAAMPEERFHLAAMLSDDGFVYVTGGLGPGSVSHDTVFIAEVGASGGIASWTSGTAMTRPRSHHASFIAEGYLYVAGGLDGNPAAIHESLSSVERAPIQGDGSLGAWEHVNDLDTAVATHGAVRYGDCILMPAGIEASSMHSSTVRRASLIDGSLSPWEAVPSALSQPRSHVHQSPIHDGRMYIIGGSTGLQQVTDAVTVGTFMP